MRNGDKVRRGDRGRCAGGGARTWRCDSAGSAIATAYPTGDYTKPKVRAITAFVRLDRATYAQQVNEALAVLQGGERASSKSRDTRSRRVRIVTQPLGELVEGQSDAEALKFLKAFDDLAAKESFIPNVGPAMMRDCDDPRTMHLLAQVLSTLPNINASAIMAGDDGIHWKVIRETRRTGALRDRSQPAQPGQFQLHRHRDAQAVWAVLSGDLSYRRRQAILARLRRRQCRAGSFRAHPRRFYRPRSRS